MCIHHFKNFFDYYFEQSFDNLVFEDYASKDNLSKISSLYEIDDSIEYYTIKHGKNGYFGFYRAPKSDFFIPIFLYHGPDEYYYIYYDFKENIRSISKEISFSIKEERYKDFNKMLLLHLPRRAKYYLNSDGLIYQKKKFDNISLMLNFNLNRFVFKFYSKGKSGYSEYINISSKNISYSLHFFDRRPYNLFYSVDLEDINLISFDKYFKLNSLLSINIDSSFIKKYETFEDFILVLMN